MTAAFKPLTKADVAEVLGISVRTVENWVDEKLLDAPAKVGARVYWHPDDFYGWLERQLRVSKDITAPSAVSATPPQKRLEKTPVSAKSDKERLRTRDQAKLDALVS